LWLKITQTTTIFDFFADGKIIDNWIFYYFIKYSANNWKLEIFAIKNGWKHQKFRKFFWRLEKFFFIILKNGKNNWKLEIFVIKNFWKYKKFRKKKFFLEIAKLDFFYYFKIGKIIENWKFLWFILELFDRNSLHVIYLGNRLISDHLGGILFFRSKIFGS